MFGLTIIFRFNIFGLVNIYCSGIFVNCNKSAIYLRTFSFSFENTFLCSQLKFVAIFRRIYNKLWNVVQFRYKSSRKWVGSDFLQQTWDKAQKSCTKFISIKLESIIITLSFLLKLVKVRKKMEHMELKHHL